MFGFVSVIKILSVELDGTLAYEKTIEKEKSVVFKDSNDGAYKFAIYVQDKLHIRPYKARDIANSSSCYRTFQIINFMSHYHQKQPIKYCDTIIF